MREIKGEAKTLRQLLSGSRYSIDYYQREFRRVRHPSKTAYRPLQVLNDPRALARLCRRGRARFAGSGKLVDLVTAV